MFQNQSKLGLAEFDRTEHTRYVTLKISVQDNGTVFIQDATGRRFGGIYADSSSARADLNDLVMRMESEALTPA